MTPATGALSVDLPPLTYLSFDSLAEGIGASQITPYVERLATRGVEVTLHTLEKSAPSEETRRHLRSAGVRWVPHDFGHMGPTGGLARVARARGWVRGAELLHARSDLPAASALLARPRAWLWDVRSLWAEERIELGTLRPGSPEHRVMQRVESASARSAGAIVTLASAVLPVLAERYGESVKEKAHVITTCVDLDRFRLGAPPPPAPVRLLLSGTLNRRYDVPAMIRFAEHLSRLRTVELEVLSPKPSPWDSELRSAGARLASARPDEMPALVARSSAGLSLLIAGQTPAEHASMPTKLGEFLACGRPVVTSGHLGDMSELLGRFDCGVALGDTSEAALEQGAAALDRLLGDEETSARCRALAEEHFDVDRGVERLLGAYEQAVSTAG